jgi:hypothetical protein
MKKKTTSSKKQPSTSEGDKGIVYFMKGKPAASAAFKKFESGKGPVLKSKSRKK